MTVALAVLMAASPAGLAHCSWDRPGHNAFTGDVVAAVDRYGDIPQPVRARLKARMAERRYDEIVTIRRDAIEGRARYGSEIRGMHFGTGQVCGTVSRARWADSATERGLVYCEDGHCILVPTVCRNVSRITRTSPALAPAPVAVLPQVLGMMGERPLDVLPAADGVAAALAPAAPAAAESGPAAGLLASTHGELPAPMLAGGDDGGLLWPGAAGQAVGLGGSAAPSFVTAAAGTAGLGLAGATNGGNPSLPALRDTLTENVIGEGTDTSPVPEPAVWWMLAAGLGLLRVQRLRRHAAGQRG